jgi:hypothetical protein
MVVEANRKLQHKIAEVLETVLGLHVLLDSTPLGAIRRCGVDQPELIILSLGFPPPAVSHFTSQVRAGNPHARIIGLEAPWVKHECPNVCDTVLAWPFTLDELVSSLRAPRNSHSKGPPSPVASTLYDDRTLFRAWQAALAICGVPQYASQLAQWHVRVQTKFLSLEAQKVFQPIQLLVGAGNSLRESLWVMGTAFPLHEFQLNLE